MRSYIENQWGMKLIWWVNLAWIVQLVAQLHLFLNALGFDDAYEGVRAHQQRTLVIVILIVVKIIVLNSIILKTKITEGNVHLYLFPLWFTKRTIPLEDIAEVELQYRKKKYHFLHPCKHGMLLYLYGRNLVHIKTKQGKKFVIGTQKPEELMAALQEKDIHKFSHLLLDG